MQNPDSAIAPPEPSEMKIIGLDSLILKLDEINNTMHKMIDAITRSNTNY